MVYKQPKNTLSIIWLITFGESRVAHMIPSSRSGSIITWGCCFSSNSTGPLHVFEENVNGHIREQLKLTGKRTKSLEKKDISTRQQTKPIVIIIIILIMIKKGACTEKKVYISTYLN